MGKLLELKTIKDVATRKQRVAEDEYYNYIKELIQSSEFGVGNIVNHRGEDYMISDFEVRGCNFVYGYTRNKNGEFGKKRVMLFSLNVGDDETVTRSMY